MTNALKIFLPATVSFIVGILITPVLTHYFYKYKMWRKVSRSTNTPQDSFHKIHDETLELTTPRTGGVIIWMSVIITIFIFGFLDFLLNNDVTNKFYFISRNQTVLPLFTLITASLIGLGDDFLQIFGSLKWTSDPIKLRHIKVSIILVLGFIIGWWFFHKLGISQLYIPWIGFAELGYIFIPFFMLIMLGVWSSSVIDGIDGLSGGIMASIFASYALIAFFHNQIDIAAFCAVITGGILSFLWFNIPPARFFMGETGMIGLTVTLATVAFLTNTVLLLPIIAFPLFITSLSTLIQMSSRRFCNGKKVFIVAPLHHHFEALGWPKYKVTMRFWIVGVVTSIMGVIISLVS
jgi:phospho-N-acetylmuramoyl-pentapeptide-transferase